MSEGGCVLSDQFVYPVELMVLRFIALHHYPDRLTSSFQTVFSQILFYFNKVILSSIPRIMNERKHRIFEQKVLQLAISHSRRDQGWKGAVTSLAEIVPL